MRGRSEGRGAAHDAAGTRPPAAALWPTSASVTVALLSWAASALYLLHWGRHWELDLRVYHAAGRALFAGRAPYDLSFTPARLPFTYPPFGLLVTSVAGFGSMGVVDVSFWVVNALAAVCTVYAALRMCRLPAGGRSWAAGAALAGLGVLLLEPARSNVDFGQVNTILFALVIADVAFVSPPWRGTLVGVAAAVKLTPAVFVLYFLVRREWRAATTAGASALGASVIGLVVMPSASLQYWRHDALDPGRTGPLGYASNQSWSGMVHRAPFPHDWLQPALWAALALVTLGVGAVAAYRSSARGRPLDALMAVALTGVVVGPVSWTHHWSWVVIVPVAALFAPSPDPVVRRSVMALLVVAVAEPYWWSTTGWVHDVSGNLLVWTGAWVLGVMALRGHGRVLPSAASH
ncbi:MAG TPA: glycosyltransferase 87 family protein [Acidimicrobiales bacterium]|nr:glycosyltransferase 87 family protein [Acidimicrobiales bacterium]